MMRAALYWTPPASNPLFAAGKSWLGRDPELNVAVAQPALEGLAQVTEDARKYGFHATLRPPMQLATGWAEFCAAADQVARETAPFALPGLQVVDFEGFLALREVAPCPALHALANRCVQLTDPHRLRPDAAELARRRARGLTAAQEAMLLRWGYPHVFSEWRFHMTLSRRLSPAEMARLLPAARAHFAAALAVPQRVRELAIFTQIDGGPFLIAERVPVKG